MLLTLWVTISLGGAATWLLGHLFGYTGVATIGAVTLVIVGGQVMLDDVQVKDGERVSHTYTDVNNSTVVEETTVNYTYATQSWTAQFDTVNAVSIGLFEALVGVLLFYHDIKEMNE